MSILPGFVIIFLFIDSGVRIQDGDDTHFLFPTDNGRVMIFYCYPFRFGLNFLPISLFQHIVTVITTVENIPKDDMQRYWVPFVPRSCTVALRIEDSCFTN